MTKRKKKRSDKNRLTPKAVHTARFEFMTNLLDETMYLCLECGAVATEELVDIHAESIHNVEYISILNVPIRSVDHSQKEEVNTIEELRREAEEKTNDKTN